MAPSVVLCLCLMVSIAAVRGVKVNVFGADPSGGLWGAHVDTIDGSQATTSRSSGYKAAVFDKFINTASYDEITKKVLIHTVEPPGLYFGPLCAANRKSPRFLFEPKTVPLIDSQMGDCVNCQTSAFAVHDGIIYFLLYGDYMSRQSITNVVEIRAFVPCDQCGDDGKKPRSEFTYSDVLKCSRLVVSIMKEEFLFEDFDDKTIKGGKSMKIVPKGDQLSFFFQLGNISHSDTQPDQVNISLWYADTKGVVKQLHGEILASRYSPWSMRALGSVDVLGNTVCWTAGDKLLCADFENDNLKNVETLLSTGEAASSDVCKGPQRDLTIMVSGVAISQAEFPMSVFFGCYPQSPGTGGAGIITVERDGRRSLQPVGTRNGPLYAGSMFITQGFDEACSWQPEFGICLGEPEVVSEPDPTEPDREEEENIIVNPEPEKETEPEENGIEGGHNDNKVPEETQSVVGDNSATRNNLYLTSVLSCLLTAFLACLLS